MKIRPATAADLPLCGPAAQEFYASSKFLQGFNLDGFVKTWTGFIAADVGVMFLLWDDDGQVAGAIGGALYPEPYGSATVCQEFFWFVSPKQRGQGVELYRELEQWARDRGCSRIRMCHMLDSMPDRLKRVYERWGFEPVEVHYEKELV
jgi:GNAT superfamily N-acetyltransferase